MAKTKFQKFQDSVSEWSDATFGEGKRAISIAYHLKKEIYELIEALEILHGALEPLPGESPGDACVRRVSRMISKFADCFMLLVDCADIMNISTDTLIEYGQLKLKINKLRKWGKPDENEVVEHIPDEADMHSGNPDEPHDTVLEVQNIRHTVTLKSL